MRPLKDFMRLNMTRYPDEIAVVDESGALTYRELVERAYALGNALQGKGVSEGDFVGILAANSNFYAECYLGILSIGATPVLFNWRWAPSELVFGVNDSGVSIVLVDSCYSDLYRAADSSGGFDHEVECLADGPAYEDLLVDPSEPVPSSSMESINVIIYTGGTTGFPKGVMLSERNIMTNALNEIVDTDMEHRDRTLIIAPMFHAASLLCWFVPHFVLGARSVFMRGFDAGTVARTVRDQEITNGFLVPNMVRQLVEVGALTAQDWSSYRRMYIGGATFRMPDKRQIERALPHVHIYYQYGLSEGGPIVTRLRPEDMYRDDIDGSIGQAFTFSDVTIRDPETMQEVQPGVVGEIMVRGPNTMTGYQGRPKETADALAGGWLHTGDLASRNADGYFFYHDRSKDMIKTGGENVYSAEVERVLYAHHDVREAAVIGVPSQRWDEEVCAVVALHSEGSTTEDDLRQFCRLHLAGYKIPRSIVFVSVDRIPVNDSGKIVKAQLRELNLFTTPVSTETR
nr:AMP-binding protein [Rhodococcus sp. 15-1154-1]